MTNLFEVVPNYKAYKANAFSGNVDLHVTVMLDPMPGPWNQPEDIINWINGHSYVQNVTVVRGPYSSIHASNFTVDLLKMLRPYISADDVISWSVPDTDDNETRNKYLRMLAERILDDLPPEHETEDHADVV